MDTGECRNLASSGKCELAILKGFKMMGTLKFHVVFIALISVTLISPNVFAVDVTFPIDGQIVDVFPFVDGYPVDNVYIRNDATVNMTGGVVGGDPGQVTLYDSSTFNLTGGTIGSGGVSGGYLSCYDNSTANIYGGRITAPYGQINTSGSSTVNLYGSSEGGWEWSVSAEDYLGSNSSIINIYGYDLEKYYEQAASAGEVTGYWLDGSPLYVSLWGVDTIDNVYLVPEPASLSLFAFGALALFRRPYGSSLRYGKTTRCRP